MNHRWQPIFGNEEGCSHAWIKRRGGSVTYCGLSRIMARTRSERASHRCKHCEAKALEMDQASEEQAREFAQERKTAADQRKKRDAIANVLEAIRPDSADPDAWREQAAKLVQMV